MTPVLAAVYQSIDWPAIFSHSSRHGQTPQNTDNHP